MQNITFPQIVIFCLPYSFWPNSMENIARPPFITNARNNKIFDRNGTELTTYYNDVPQILKTLTKKGIKIGVVHTWWRARFNIIVEALKSLGLDKYVTWYADPLAWYETEITNMTILDQIESVRKESKCSPTEILYFDTNSFIVNQTEEILGVAAYVVPQEQDGGLTMNVTKAGIRRFIQLNEESTRTHTTPEEVEIHLEDDFTTPQVVTVETHKFQGNVRNIALSTNSSVVERVLRYLAGNIYGLWAL